MSDTQTLIRPDTKLELPPQRLVDVNGMTIRFGSDAKPADVVRDLTFHVDRGETLSIVGESGSGKSVSSLALMRIVENGGGRIIKGDMRFRRRNNEVVDLRAASPQLLRKMRGADMAMIFQEPMTSLNPVFTVGQQISEAVRLHQNVSQHDALREAKDMLDRVRIPNASAILRRYPHELSGGMRQRVMIAMALSCKPSLLIADEPTTALDVTVQAQILTLIRELQKEMDMGVIFITHDMGVVAEVADRVLVMYRGDQVEEKDAVSLFKNPEHAYSRALLSAVPQLGAMTGTDVPARFPLLTMSNPDVATAEKPVAAPTAAEPILKVRDLKTHFDIRGGILSRVTHKVHAVEQVSFDLYPGETLSIVGESGCGKTTTGRSLLNLTQKTSGTVLFEGKDVSQPNSPDVKKVLQRNMQFVFQDPFSSLDPRQSIGNSILEPLRPMGSIRTPEAKDRLAWLMEKVGLAPEMANRYPHEFSGGQRQRICIARALAVNPKVVITDEAVSALDVSIQAQIVNLLMDLQEEFNIAFLFISHDMAVVERISHRVAVMYLGQIVEIGPRRAVFENPQHEYTKRLMSAVPVADPSRKRPDRLRDTSDLPSPTRALGDDPIVEPLVEVGPGHFVARHKVGGKY
ncbi:dipeptide ABC transporter ATP-binding protein [Pseudooceanicola nanhaiensis]|uniref:dipeptide ABC transporter ATP-binding protein n=1 Tax=Pseudooceanicola nanhaiensis TaxID=375761 RepID=UPI001CD58106|nr:dipeptide ABC transporter ATP-binding protein [Pseudooceanicola nanhaiensis]MCA0921542.1 dipeptide ABC transporter ATP-binding protein [Pseudooceanicola nanhaiensis]